MHKASTRFSLGFDGPTRNSRRSRRDGGGGAASASSASGGGGSPPPGYRSQTVELTVLAARGSLDGSSCGVSDGRFGVTRSFVQNNVEQELQTFYREILTLTPSASSTTGAAVDRVTGKLRVAAFLPKYDELGGAGAVVSNDPIENQRAGPGPRLPLRQSYDDGLAVALYDYDVELVAEAAGDS